VEEKGRGGGGIGKKVGDIIEEKKPLCVQGIAAMPEGNEVAQIGREKKTQQKKKKKKKKTKEKEIEKPK